MCSLVEFLPTNIESDWNIYGIDLHYMYILIKETKIFFSGDKKNKKILIQVLYVMALSKKKVCTLSLSSFIHSPSGELGCRLSASSTVYCTVNILDACFKFWALKNFRRLYFGHFFCPN